MSIKSSFYFSFGGNGKYPIIELCLYGQFNIQITSLDTVPQKFYEDLLAGKKIEFNTYDDNSFSIEGDGNGNVIFSVKCFDTPHLNGSIEVTTKLEEIRKDFEEYLRKREVE